MKPLSVTASDDISRWFRLLEHRGLIRPLAAPRRILSSPKGRGAVSTVYASSPRFGPHKLICVKPDSAVPKLNSHPDNEEFILLDPRAGVRPLYLLIGLLPASALKAKTAAGTLSADDFVLLKMKFNDPRFSVFTMPAGTVHCEIVFPGKGPAPVFFVTEPRDLPMELLRSELGGVGCVPERVEREDAPWWEAGEGVGDRVVEAHGAAAWRSASRASMSLDASALVSSLLEVRSRSATFMARTRRSLRSVMPRSLN
jgi:hypothetical protein